MASQARIYVSVPDETHLSPDQVQIKHTILEALANRGFAPQIFYESGQPAGQSWSFANADRLMAECHGAVVLSLAKWHSAELISGKSADLASEFNHFEGALAIAHDIPLLIVTEQAVQFGGITDFAGGELISIWPSDVGAEWVKSQKFERYLDEWATKVQAHRKVFLGYCSAAKDTAMALIKWMESLPNVSVLNYVTHFRPGLTILEEIENAAKECSVGVFLFTMDDEIVGTESHVAPRDNVILETGYFIRAKGNHRVLIIREEGAKVPADLGGVIYLSLQDRANIAPLEASIERFLDTNL